MKIGLLSDNHSHWDERMDYHLKDCDEIWHAGDIGSFAVTDAIEALNPNRSRIVYGNIDDHVMRAEFDEELSWKLQGITFFMTHIGGRPGRYAKGVRTKLMQTKPDVFICGHSHLLLIKRDDSWGGLYLNPGACGVHGFHQKRTLVTFVIRNGNLDDMRIVELGNRSTRIGV
ncbi:MAG: YfcE family phosphodiesterase [Crocinitomicaceae bacterium]|nr:YfcE family phosphodiesterase [Crocinitomicaceae bacterium]